MARTRPQRSSSTCAGGRGRPICRTRWACPRPLPRRAPVGRAGRGASWRRSPGASGCRAGVPVILGGADSQACALGAGVVAEGPVSEMAGSSTCLNAAVHEAAAVLEVTHYPHVVPGPYTTETGINTTGAAIAWMADLLYAPRGRRAGAADYERLDREVGICARRSRWRAGPPGPGRRRTDRSGPARRVHRASPCATTARVLARAMMEGVAFAIRDQLDLLAGGGARVTELRVSGGDTRLAIVEPDQGRRDRRAGRHGPWRRGGGRRGDAGRARCRRPTAPSRTPSPPASIPDRRIEPDRPHPHPLRRALRRLARAGCARLSSGGTTEPMRLQLGINTCFAVKRWPLPEDWAPIVRDQLGLRLVQHSLDLVDLHASAEGLESQADALQGRRSRPRPRAALHLHRPGGLLVEPAPVARCGRSRSGARRGCGPPSASPPISDAGDRRTRRVLLGRRLARTRRGATSCGPASQACAGGAGHRRARRRPRVPGRREPRRRAGALDHGHDPRAARRRRRRRACRFASAWTSATCASRAPAARTAIRTPGSATLGLSPRSSSSSNRMRTATTTGRSRRSTTPRAASRRTA